MDDQGVLQLLHLGKLRQRDNHKGSPQCNYSIIVNTSTKLLDSTGIGSLSVHSSGNGIRGSEFHRFNNERHKQAIADYLSLIDSSNTALIALEDIAANLRCNISLETYRPNWVKGLKIQAIKDYRQDSGLVLKDAKDDLEYYFRDVKVNHPNANNAPTLGDIL